MPFARCQCGAMVSPKIQACPCCGVRISFSKQKYRNQRTKATVQGKERKFDSRGESSRAKALELLEREGAISGLKLQPRFVLVPETSPPIVYIPDFLYCEDGRAIAEDFKSAATRKDKVFALKLRLWKWRGPCWLRLSMMKARGRYSFEMIPPGGEPIKIR